MNEAKKQKMKKKKRNGSEPRLMMMVLVGSEGERNATLRWWLTIEEENELNDVVVRIFSTSNEGEWDHIYTRARDCFLISFFALLLLKANGIMRACKRRWWDGVCVCIYVCMYCEKDEMLTRLSSLFNYFYFSFQYCLLNTYIHWQCEQLSSFIDVRIYSFSLTLAFFHSLTHSHSLSRALFYTFYL